MKLQEPDPRKAVKEIEANVARVRAEVGIWARHWAGRYNGSVWLLGSILHNPSPRDCDIRAVLLDHEFGARYGMEMKPTTKEGRTACIAWDEEGPTQRWIDDVAKFNAALSVKLKLNMDVQVWPESHWRPDTYPPPILLAAPSPKWWFYNAHVPDPTKRKKTT